MGQNKKNWTETTNGVRFPKWMMLGTHCWVPLSSFLMGASILYTLSYALRAPHIDLGTWETFQPARLAYFVYMEISSRRMRNSPVCSSFFRAGRVERGRASGTHFSLLYILCTYTGGVRRAAPCSLLCNGYVCVFSGSPTRLLLLYISQPQGTITIHFRRCPPFIPARAEVSSVAKRKFPAVASL